MSHTAKIPNVKVNDLDALDRAAADIGLQLVRDQKTYQTYSKQKCDHALRLPNSGAYEIGVVKAGDHFDLMQDTFLGGKGMVDAVGGHEAPKLIQSYAAQVAMAHYLQEGWNVTKTQTEDGRIFLRCQN